MTLVLGRDLANPPSANACDPAATPWSYAPRHRRPCTLLRLVHRTERVDDIAAHVVEA